MLGLRLNVDAAAAIFRFRLRGSREGVSFFPCRSTSTGAPSLGCFITTLRISSKVAMGAPSMATMRSPVFICPESAGPPFMTSTTVELDATESPPIMSAAKKSTDAKKVIRERSGDDRRDARGQQHAFA